MTREQFDVRDPFTISKCKETKGNTLTRKLIDLAERSGIRRKEVLEAGKTLPQLEKMLLLHTALESSLLLN
ncbi:MAG TPA: hypothetical protein VFG90_07430 [Nitrososphaeraceae archaeon]|nr:hypothetical protein [Nitrososphaeraceae archaeon]